MKAYLFVLISFIFAGFVCAQNPHDREASEAVRNFTFPDRYGGCDEAVDGRWYLHFQPDGSIRIGLWSSDKSRKLRYHYDDEKAPHVDLADVFEGSPTWRRVGPFTLEIKNGGNSHLFTLVPNYRAGEAKNAANFIKFFEVGSKGRVFEIGFLPEYEDKFQSSKEFR